MKSLPGDTEIECPYWHADQGIMIKARPEQVWPWIVQMGNGRAGWYSYDLIDNFGKKSYQHIDPNLQKIVKGQKIPLFTFSDFKENEFLTMTVGKRCNMTWALEARADETYLLTRLRVKGPQWLLSLTLGPGHWIMQDKQFREIKKRVEPID